MQHGQAPLHQNLLGVGLVLRLACLGPPVKKCTRQKSSSAHWSFFYETASPSFLATPTAHTRNVRFPSSLFKARAFDDYCADERSVSAITQSMLRGVMQMTTRMIVNGEKSERCFTNAQVHEMIECAIALVVRRDGKASNSSHSFNGKMAWCKLDSAGAMHESPQRKLERAQALLRCDLTEAQRELATARLCEIEAALRPAR